VKLHDIYRAAVEKGVEYDPRGREGVERYLQRVKEVYEKLSDEEKREHGAESLVNPYTDTRVLYGQRDREITSKIMVGIDISIGEILLADRLREKGMNIDLVISHHPAGKALIKFFKVMNMQADILNSFGIPINVAEDLLEERVAEVEHSLLPVNVNQAPDAAKLLDVPFMCIHTPADNAVATHLQGIMDEEKPDTVDAVVTRLKEEPEFKHYSQKHMEVQILAGKPDRRAGKVFVDMTGGTEGSIKILAKLSIAGIGTLVVMHMKPKYIEEARKHHLNVVLAGHMASDSLGTNLIIDHLCSLHPFEILECGGFRRFQRN